MAKGSDVLRLLVPQGGWVITGDDFDSIRWDEGVTPVTKKEFEEGFAKADKWLADRDAETAAKKATAEAKLAALGLTADDLKALGLA